MIRIFFKYRKNKRFFYLEAICECKMLPKKPIEYFLITNHKEDKYEPKVLKTQVAVKFIIDKNSVTDNNVEIVMSYLISVKWLIFCTTSKTVPVNFFQHNSKIQYLRIRADNVTSLPTGLFEGLKQLKCLSLQTRNLETIPNEIRFCKSIRHFSIEGLIIDKVNLRKSMNLRNLKSFNIQNSFGVRPYPEFDLDTFRCLSHLQDMELTCITVTDTFFPAIKHINLTKLSIYDSDFSFEAFFEIFSSMPNLEYLYFRKCSSLCCLNGLILDKKLSALKYLYFIDCHLRSVPVGILQSCNMLKVLSLRGNIITVISDYAFSNNRRLVALDLSDNQISGIQTESFKNLRKLVVLNLEMNDLSNDDNALTDAFVHLKNLEYVNLNRNPVRWLSLSVSTQNQKLNLIRNEGSIFDDKSAFRPKPFSDKAAQWFGNKVDHKELYFNFCY